MDGLIIKRKWLNMFFDGSKDFEMRGYRTKKTGLIALIESGTKTVVGIANLSSCLYIPINLFDNFYSHHKLEKPMYEKNYAWPLLGATKIRPTPYEHKKGQQIWVKNVF